MYRKVKVTRIAKTIFFPKTILKKNQYSQNSFEKRMKLEDSVSNFKMFCKATLIKTVWCIDQRHRIESPEIDLFGYSQVIF